MIERGDIVKKEGWTSCVLHVKDIGKFSFWGVLYDVKKNEIAHSQFVAPLDQDWIFVLDLVRFDFASLN